MIKEFCKKCYGKLFCVEKQPQMNADDVISIILQIITQKSANESIKLLYILFHPDYRSKLGGYSNYKKWIQTHFPGFMSAIQINLLDSFKEIDECYGYFRVSYMYHNKPIVLKIEMERAYDYLNNLPMYDRYTKTKLYLFWRISKIMIEKDKVKLGRRIVFGRE